MKDGMFMKGRIVSREGMKCRDARVTGDCEGIHFCNWHVIKSAVSLNWKTAP